MSYFRVMPNTLCVQREELESCFRELCRDSSELSGVIRRLGTMSGFEYTMKKLNRVQGTMSDQLLKLRQCAIVLGNVADIYTRAELKNLDGDAPWERGLYSILLGPPEPAWGLQEMLPDAEALFGMKVTIRQRD